MELEQKRTPKPKWLRVKLPVGKKYQELQKVVEENNLHTICDSGNCPNKGECWGAGTATFMILGNVCTRSCGFCAITTGRGETLEVDEPERVADAAYELGLKYVVLTSVARDDLSDEVSTTYFKPR